MLPIGQASRLLQLIREVGARIMHRSPFESIEDTLEYLSLLDLTISESRRDLEVLAGHASGDRSRSALLLALYKLSQLSECVRQSKRILNDLDLIRTAMMGAGASETKNRPKPQPSRNAALERIDEYASVS